MRESIYSVKEKYYRWLVASIIPEEFHDNCLYRFLHANKFVWSIPNDDNRSADGQMLREEFYADNAELPEYDVFIYEDCSFLEMLIALSRRMAYETTFNPTFHMHELLKNIGLFEFAEYQKLPDHQIRSKVDKAVLLINNREYSYNGGGGLFPLRYPEEDQRNVEIWYQMMAYLMEKGYCA